MIERIYIHNYKGFVNFEMKCGPFVFLMGGNGSGKSSLLDVLHRLTAFMREGNLAVFPGESRFRFGDFPTQAFELDVRLGAHLYRYAIEIDYKDDRRLVKRESLSLDETPILKLQEGRFFLYSDDGMEIGHFPVDTTKGGMFFFGNAAFKRVEPFNRWIETCLALQLNPLNIRRGTEGQVQALQLSGANFAAWFESAYQADTARLPDYYQRLKQLIPGFRSINWKQQYHAEKVIEVEFMRNGRRDSFQLNELSTGELSLLIHYAILHFGLQRNTTLALDEPDNFLSLSEVEPLIYAIEDEVERANAQVFLISHHPEFFDRWAKDPSRTRYLERTEQGMFRLKEIDWSRSPGLSPSEVVARGWQDA